MGVFRKRKDFMDEPCWHSWMSTRDRTLLAEEQLAVINETLGFVAEGHVRTAAVHWADEYNEEQYYTLRNNLMHLVSA